MVMADSAFIQALFSGHYCILFSSIKQRHVPRPGFASCYVDLKCIVTPRLPSPMLVMMQGSSHRCPPLIRDSPGSYRLVQVACSVYCGIGSDGLGSVSSKPATSLIKERGDPRGPPLAEAISSMRAIGTAVSQGALQHGSSCVVVVVGFRQARSRIRTWRGSKAGELYESSKRIPTVATYSVGHAKLARPLLQSTLHGH